MSSFSTAKIHGLARSGRSDALITACRNVRRHAGNAVVVGYDGSLMSPLLTLYGTVVFFFLLTFFFFFCFLFIGEVDGDVELLEEDDGSSGVHDLELLHGSSSRE